MVHILPEIDREATKRNVEKVLEQTRIFRQIGFVRRDIKNTPLYEYRFHGPTNRTSDPAGDTASWNIDNEHKLIILVERVQEAVERLPNPEKEIIKLRYLNDEEIYDYTIYNDLNYSESKYYRIKARAFYRLAFALRLTVFKEE